MDYRVVVTVDAKEDMNNHVQYLLYENYHSLQDYENHMR